jgi:hypothetical protein
MTWRRKLDATVVVFGSVVPVRPDLMTDREREAFADGLRAAVSRTMDAVRGDVE